MGLEGQYLVFNEKGEPWGVVDMNLVAAHEIAQPLPPLRRRFAQYLLGERNLTPSTAFTYEQSLMRLERFTGIEAHLISVAEMRRFLRESDFNPGTKSGSLVAMKAFHRWAEVEGEPWANAAFQSLVAPKQLRNPKPSLEVVEARTLLTVCRRSREFRVIGLGLLAGLRVSEAASISEEEWLRDRLRFVGKGRKLREVPIVPELAALKGMILQRGPTTADSLKGICRSLSHVTGVPFTSHTLRRTFSNTLRRAGVPREVIGAILGHAPVSVTETYTPVEFEEMVDAMKRLSYEEKKEAIADASKRA